MAALGEAAVEQRPVLVDLSAARRRTSSGSSTTPAEFAEVARPAIRALGEAAADRAARPCAPRGRSIARAAPATPSRRPTSRRNLRITARGLRRPRARGRARPAQPAGGSGYSGTQALLRYIFSQSLTINGFDEFGLHGPRGASSRTTARRTRTPSARRPSRSSSSDAARGSGPTSPASPARSVSAAARPRACVRRTRAARRRRRPRHRAAPTRRPRATSPDPRLPARAMTRRPSTSIVASPALIGAVTVLVTIVAVFLAYNANQGLPFVPTLEVKVLARQRVGGRRAAPRCARAASGSASCATIRTARARGRHARRAEIHAVLEARRRRDPGGHHLHDPPALAARPEVPGDGARRLRPRRPGDGHVFPVEQTTVPVEFDDVARIYDAPTRRGIQRSLQGFGNALAGRGTSLNQAIERAAAAPRHLEPGRAQPRRPRARASAASSRELGDAARVVAPLADEQSDFFTRAGAHVRGDLARPRGAQGDDRAHAPGAPGGDRVVPGPAPVPDRQRRAGARDAAGGARAAARAAPT